VKEIVEGKWPHENNTPATITAASYMFLQSDSHPELKKFNLIISGRDWCNLFDEISQEQIDQMHEKAMQSEQ
jgi:hypothetical protein